MRLSFDAFEVILRIRIIKTTDGVGEGFGDGVGKEFTGHALDERLDCPATTQCNDRFAERHGFDRREAKVLFLGHYKGSGAAII